ncbi:MAG: 5'-nucleotidase C-terminal domain-containing protein [Hydrogenophilales bacterium]|nr:5'-nucleotidase C-terminal domain-containing protein [Hydrogenophilales bacterium]
MQASAVTLTFIENNDLHAHLTPALDKVVKNGQVVYESRGGLARVATLVKQIRAQNPNSVLMNVGDTYHGGVEALYTSGNAVIDPVNALGIDVGVPGNWDFAYGPNVLRLRYFNLTTAQRATLQKTVPITIKQPNFQNLAANMQSTLPGTPTQPLPASVIKTISGVQVGFIGLTSDIVAQMDATLAVGLSFTQGETAYRDLLNSQAQALRNQGAQLVMVMSELGLQKDYRLADIINAGAVDVFFSAHTHDTIFTPLQSKSGALIVEGGHSGWLGRMDVNVASGQKPVFNWTLLSVDSSIPDDPAMKTLVDAARAPFLVANPNMTVPMNGITLKLTQPIDTVLSHVYVPLDREEALESTFNDAWSDTLRQQTGTAIAITPGFRMDAPIPAAGTLYEDNYIADGALTIEDVYRYIPVPYTLGTGTVEGATIKSIIENDLTAVYSLDSFSQGGGWASGWSGLNVTVDLSKPDGQRVQSLADANGAPIADTTVLTASGCLRPNDVADGTGTVLCSFSGFSNVAALINPSTGNPWYPQEMLSAALTQGFFVDSPRQGITDLAATPAWPSQPFVQPLAVRATSGAQLTKSGLVYNAGSKIFTGQITLTNTGSIPLLAPLKVVIQGLPAGVTVVNAAGSYYSQPYLKLTGSLAPGNSQSVQVQFKSTSNHAITYTPAAYTGGV